MYRNLYNGQSNQYSLKPYLLVWCSIKSVIYKYNGPWPVLFTLISLICYCDGDYLNLQWMQQFCRLVSLLQFLQKWHWSWQQNKLVHQRSSLQWGWSLKVGSFGAKVELFQQKISSYFERCLKGSRAQKLWVMIPTKK